MAWVSGVDQVPGYLVTAADWNNYLGTDSDKGVNYLKTELDKIGDISFADQSGSRAIGTLTYQASTKVRFVSATVYCVMNAADGELNSTARTTFKTDDSSPASVAVSYGGFNLMNLSGLSVENQTIKVAFPQTVIVQDSHYFGESDDSFGDGSVDLLEWVEWDLM